MKTITNRLLLIFVLVTSVMAMAADKKSDPRADYIRANYTKYEYQIPMRYDVK